MRPFGPNTCLMDSDTDFLPAFFGAGNLIPWVGQSTDHDPDSERALRWVERYRSGLRPTPLPRVREHTGQKQTTWYVIVDDRDTASLTRAELQGFLGPSYTDWDPLSDRFDPEDAIDELVLGQHPSALKMTITGSRHGVPYAVRAARVRERLEVWLEARERMPTQVLDERELLADLLYQFEDALRLDRPDLAEANLQKMEGSGGLSPENLIGLEFLYLNGVRAWSEIWSKPAFDRLVEFGPTQRVRQVMLRAAYRCEIQHYEDLGDAESALEAYSSVVAPRCAPLLGTSRGLNTPEAHVLRLLKEVTSTSPSPARIESARSDALQIGVPEHWTQSLVQVTDSTEGAEAGSTVEVFATVGREFGLNNLDSAWSLALSADESTERSVWLMRLALEAESIRWAHIALESLDQLSPYPSSDLLDSFRDKVTVRFGSSSGDGKGAGVPGGWREWAQHLTKPERFSAGVKLAEEGGVDWDVHAEAIPDWNVLTEVLNGVTEVNERILRRSVPYLLDAIGDEGSPRGGLGGLYDHLLDVVLLDPAPGDTYFVSVEDLVDRRLSVGIGAGAYGTLLREVSERVDELMAPLHVPDVLDLVDLLYFRSCPDQEARIRFVNTVLNSALSDLERLSEPVLAVLSEVADSLEWTPNPFDDQLSSLQDSSSQEGEGVGDVLGGLSIALYSLDESAMRRATLAIERISATVTVRTYSDKVASERLLATARNADLFIVAHRAAKHAATEAIQAARVGPLRFAQGKGSTSLVRAVWDWATEALHAVA